MRQLKVGLPLAIISALCFAAVSGALAQVGVGCFAKAKQSAPASSAALNAVIIGSGSPQFDPKRGGPSVLVRLGDTEILVDIGNGTQAQLDKLQLPIAALDGLLFTHHHLDHNEEFIPVFIRSLLGGNHFVLAGPAPMRKMVDSTLELYKADIEYRMRRSGRSLQDVKGKYTVRELTGGEKFAVGDIKISTVKVNHTIASNAIRFDAGDRSIVVSGDLIDSPALSVLAKDADYLIIDSGGTIKTGEGNARGQGARGEGPRGGARNGGARNAGAAGAAQQGAQRAHVNLTETARMAKDAGVKILVLTHFTNGVIDEAATIAVLRKGFAGKIIFAADLMKIDGFAN
jgi:ribonuclease BN (tRNA processing enzyme)